MGKDKVQNVIIVNDFNYVQGGASKVAIDTARLLKDEGLNVYFFSAVNKSDENIEGITYVSTNQNEALKEKNKLKGVINGIYNFKAKKDFKKLLKKLNPENTIIHVHGWTKALSSSVFDIAFKMKFKVVLTFHDYFTACPNGGYFNYKQNEICHLKPLSLKCLRCNCDSRNYSFKLYRIVRQFVQNKIVKVDKKINNKIFISKFSKKILDKTIKENDYVQIIENPTEPNNNNEIQKDMGAKSDYYVFVGRVCQEKGVDIFCKEITNLKYNGMVIGDGPMLEELKEKYSNISFKGWLSKEDVEKYMLSARALVFPSMWYETAGLTVIEAMILGVPTIVSKVSAASCYINDNINGILFDPYKKNDLSKKIEQLDDNKLNAIRKEAVKIRERFSNKTYVGKIIGFYNEVIEKEVI